MLDAEAAWRLVHELVGPEGLSFGAGLRAAAIVKHTNPCGVAIDEDLGTAYRGPSTPIPSRPSAASWP